MKYMKPSISQDVIAIIKKFPCNNEEVPKFILDFVRYLNESLEEHLNDTLFCLGRNGGGCAPNIQI